MAPLEPAGGAVPPATPHVEGFIVFWGVQSSRGINMAETNIYESRRKSSSTTNT